MNRFLVSAVIGAAVLVVPGRAESVQLSSEELLKTIQSHYFRTDAPNLEERLREGAARGLLAELNQVQRDLLVKTEGPVQESGKKTVVTEEEMQGGLDKVAPNRLLTANQSKLMKQERSGAFGGIGLILKEERERGMFSVQGVIPGMPSEKGGIKVGDTLVSVDGQSLASLALLDMVGKLRGKEGTTVRLTLDRNGKKFDVTLTRDTVKIPSVEFTPRPGGVAHLKILSFHSGVVHEVKKALAEAASKKVWGMVIDLRGNPGGVLDACVETTKMFLNPQQMIVRTVRHGQPEEVYKATEPPVFSGPLVLLVNRFTGSSAEIFTEALRENNKALVVGERTMGKGTSETVFDLRSGHTLFLSTGAFFGPSGRSPSPGGLKPDVALESSSMSEPKEPQSNLSKLGAPPSPDSALETAFGILTFARK